MLVNENNIAESVRVLGILEKEVLKDLGENGQYIKTGEMYATQKLVALAEILTTLEMNDRMSGNAPTPNQKNFALNLERDYPDKAKDVLAFLGKKSINELSKETISIFIKQLSGRD